METYGRKKNGKYTFSNDLIEKSEHNNTYRKTTFSDVKIINNYRYILNQAINYDIVNMILEYFSFINDVIACGGNSFVLTNNGYSLGQGNYNCSILDIPQAIQSKIIKISGGYSHIVMLTSERRVHAIGSNQNGQSKVPDWVNTKTVDVECGYDFTILKQTNNTLFGFGNNRSKQIELPYKPYAKNIIQMAGGANFSLILTDDNHVHCYGNNDYGQIKIDPIYQGNIANVYAGGFCTILKLRSGELVGLGLNKYGQLNKEFLTYQNENVKKVSIGATYAIILYKDGSVKCSGNNDCGQISIPNEISNKIKNISAGTDHTLIYTYDNIFVAIGNNEYKKCNVNLVKSQIDDIFKN